MVQNVNNLINFILVILLGCCCECLLSL